MWALNLPAMRLEAGGLAVCRVVSANGEGGAGNGVRTRDIQLGRLTLYQLSYSRGGNRERDPVNPDELRRTGAERRIRTSVTRCVADLQSAAINHSAISACLSGAPPGACQSFPEFRKSTPWEPLSGFRVKGTARQGFPDRELERYHGNGMPSRGNFRSAPRPHEEAAPRRASTRKSVTAAAADTFRLSMPPGMGMCSRPS